MNALKTDRYELSMIQALIAEGKADEPAVFECFTRRLPSGMRYGVFAGIGRLLPMLKDFEFSPDELGWLHHNNIINTDTFEYFLDFKFSGTIDAYAEGELFFPNSPVVTVTGTKAECMLVETLTLSALNHDSAIASTAARMVTAANGRPLIEMGSRRTHEDAAVAAARAAYIAGFDSTSNLQAGYTYGIPTKGTAAHAFTLAHDNELQAFTAQVKAFGAGTTLLVDTYNIERGIRTAVLAAGTKLGAIRIDSGDLAREARNARKLLDSLGATETKIIVTSDLDEFVLKDLTSAPIDGYGVGTKLVTPHPMGLVYKLVEDKGVPKAKSAKDKVSIGGRKDAYRLFDRDQKVMAEVTVPHGAPAPLDARRLNLTTRQDTSGHEFARHLHRSAKAELPEGEQAVWHGDFGPFLTCTPLTKD